MEEYEAIANRTRRSLEPISKRTRRSGLLDKRKSQEKEQHPVTKRVSLTSKYSNAVPGEVIEQESGSDKESIIGSILSPLTSTHSNTESNEVIEQDTESASLNMEATEKTEENPKKRKLHAPLKHDGHLWHVNKSVAEGKTIYYDCAQ